MQNFRQKDMNQERKFNNMFYFVNDVLDRHDSGELEKVYH